MERMSKLLYKKGMHIEKVNICGHFLQPILYVGYLLLMLNVCRIENFWWPFFCLSALVSHLSEHILNFYNFYLETKCSPPTLSYFYV